MDEWVSTDDGASFTMSRMPSASSPGVDAFPDQRSPVIRLPQGVIGFGYNGAGLHDPLLPGQLVRSRRPITQPAAAGLAVCDDQPPRAMRTR